MKTIEEKVRRREAGANLILRFVKPVHERQDASRKTGRETAAEEEVAEVRLTVEAVIDDGANARTDQPVLPQSQSQKS